MGDELMVDIIKSHSLKTIREEFDDYLLEDGNTLRIKDVVVGFGFSGKFEKTKDGKEVLKAIVKVHQIVGLIPTGKVDVSTLTLLDRPLTETDRLEKVNFEPIKTSLNFYETDDFLIIVRNRLNEVWRTPFKDQDNIPVLGINSSTSLDSPNKITLAIIQDEKMKLKE